MKIRKSSNHTRITGDFGEHVVLYWLSKYGFECAQVDHTGIDLIAINPCSSERMGISVKTRSQGIKAAGSSVNIPRGHFKKVSGACDAFGCLPYFAIVIDSHDIVRVYLLPMSRLVEMHPPGKSVTVWPMNAAAIRRYETDSEIKSFLFQTSTGNWWGKGASF